MGVGFDKVYFESQTYKKGRDIVLKGLADGVLYRKETGSVWADLTGDGLVINYCYGTTVLRFI